MDDIIKKVHERTGVSKDIIKQIEHDLWRDVKKYTYQPHEMLGSIILGNVLKITVRYKMVKRLSFQYAISEYPKYRQLAAYYKVICEVLERTKFRHKNSNQHLKLEEYYSNKFKIKKDEHSTR